MGKPQRYCCKCDAEVSAEEVGCCVWGSCGHRLYQGTLGRIDAVTIPETSDLVVRLARLHASVRGDS